MDNNRHPQKDFERLFGNSIALYGAGVTGVETYKILTNHFKNVNVTYFCDTYKTGHMSGLPIISPEELKAMCARESLIVVVTA